MRQLENTMVGNVKYASDTLEAPEGPSKWMEIGYSQGFEHCKVSLLVMVKNTQRRAFLDGILRDEGFVNIRFSRSGIETFQAVEFEQPDMLIIDLDMPSMDGFETCRKLKETPTTSNLPILTMSACEGNQDIKWAFQSGASDIVATPIEPSELVSRIGMLLGNQELLRELIRYRERVATELSLAHDMQRGICPTREEIDQIRDRYGLIVESYFAPSTELSGDLLGLQPVDADKFAFYMADITGHGVAAAISAFRLHALMINNKVDPERPDKILSAMNSALCKFFVPGEFATMICGYIDIGQQELVYSSAGFSPPFVMNKEQDDDFQTCESSGLPLGLRAGTQYKIRRVQIPPDSRILIYSDALIESPDKKGVVLDEAGILQLINEYAREDVLEKSDISFTKRCADIFNHPLSDDLSMLYFQMPARNHKVDIASFEIIKNQYQSDRLREEAVKRASAVGALVSAEFDIRDLQQARFLATMLSQSTPNPQGVVTSMLELMINAIEHGNLEIGFDTKTDLIEKQQWQQEVDRRLGLVENAEKFARVSFMRTDAEIIFGVVDCGEGFDASKYLNNYAPPRGCAHGRGILMANTLGFDSLEYLGNGNEVLARISLNI